MKQKDSRRYDESGDSYDIHPERQRTAFLKGFPVFRRGENRDITGMGGITAAGTSVFKETFRTGKSAFWAEDRSKTSSAGRTVFRIQADFSTAMFAKKTRSPLLHTGMRGLSRGLITSAP